MLSTLDEEVGNAKLSCGQSKPARAKQGQMSVGDGKATKDKTDSWRITPAESIFIQPSGFILTKVSKYINQ